jgi:hypothetical protein
MAYLGFGAKQIFHPVCRDKRVCEAFEFLLGVEER